MTISTTLFRCSLRIYLCLYMLSEYNACVFVFFILKMIKYFFTIRYLCWKKTLPLFSYYYLNYYKINIFPI